MSREYSDNTRAAEPPPPVGQGEADTDALRRAEAALRESEERFRALTEQASDIIAVIDDGNRVSYVSSAIERVLGYTPADVVGQVASLFVDPAAATRAEGLFAAHRLRQGDLAPVEFRVRHKDGSWRVLEAVARNQLDNPAVRGIIINARDVTDRAQAEEALRASEGRFRALSEHATDLVAIADAGGVIRYASPSYRTGLGYDPAELEGTSALDIAHPDDRARILEGMRARAGVEGSVGRVEFRVRHKDGSWRTLDVTTNNRLGDPAVGGIITVARDVTERKRAEEALLRQALHDPLTGLPNRTLLRDRLEQSLRAAARERAPLALFLLDLDRFKEVNDTLGHAAGDTLLQEVGRRLRGAVRASDTVARLSGDEFAALLPGVDEASAVATARKLLAALSEPLALDGETVVAGGSIGIALFPEHGADAATLLRHADVAMYAAKRGGSGYALYTPDQDQHSPGRLTLIGALQRAIMRDELRLHYQPMADVYSGRVRTVEALARWRHPERGLMLPDQFIPLAEQTGLIVPLTRWALNEALRQVRRWADEGLDLGVAVNLSARVLRDPELPATVEGLLRTHGVSAAKLRVELTESMVMADPALALAALTRLSGQGVRIAIDDFGTGYSSLAYLKRLPVDEVKIDRSFVAHMTTDGDDAAIVASTIGLGHSLGLRFVAEGVESRDTWQSLEALGCDSIQGFYVSRALPPDELVRWLRETPHAGGGSPDS